MRALRRVNRATTATTADAGAAGQVRRGLRALREERREAWQRDGLRGHAAVGRRCVGVRARRGARARGAYLRALPVRREVLGTGHELVAPRGGAVSGFQACQRW